MVEAVTRRPVVFSGILVLLILIPVAFRSAITTVSASAAEVRPSTVEVAMLRLGLRPEALAAAGLDGTDVTTAIANLEEELSAAPTALATADANLAAAKREADRLERIVRSGTAPPEDVAALQQARVALANARSQRASHLDDLFTATLADAQSGEQSSLSTMRSNAASWEIVEAPLLSVSRTQAEWVALREALAAERISARYGEAVPSEVVSLLASERAEVASAQAAMDANLPAVLQAWQNAFSE